MQTFSDIPHFIQSQRNLPLITLLLSLVPSVCQTKVFHQHLCSLERAFQRLCHQNPKTSQQRFSAAHSSNSSTQPLIRDIVCSA